MDVTNMPCGIVANNQSRERWELGVYEHLLDAKHWNSAFMYNLRQILFHKLLPFMDEKPMALKGYATHPKPHSQEMRESRSELGPGQGPYSFHRLNPPVKRMKDRKCLEFF